MARTIGYVLVDALRQRWPGYNFELWVVPTNGMMYITGGTRAKTLIGVKHPAIIQLDDNGLGVKTTSTDKWYFFEWTDPELLDQLYSILAVVLGPGMV